MECLMFSTLWNKYHESFNTDLIFTPEDLFYVIKYGGPGVREQELWILIYSNINYYFWLSIFSELRAMSLIPLEFLM